MAEDPRGIEAQLQQVARALVHLEEQAQADRWQYRVGAPELRRLLGTRHKTATEKLADAVAEWHQTLRWLAKHDRHG